jgi:methyl-accepting chemotaxis protein
LAKEPTLNFLNTQSSLSALYKPKGSISPQASAPLTAFREFNAAVADWSKLMGATVGSAKPAAGSVPFTWSLLIGSKTPWRQLNAQMDALEGEAKLTENAVQAKSAQDLLKALNQNNLLQTIQSTDAQMAKVWVAHERLLASLEKLPPVPTVVLAPTPFSWSQLAFPGNAEEALMGAMALLVIGLSVLIAAHISRQQHLKLMSQKWLSLTQQLETTLRDVTQPLAASVHQQEELILEFNRLLDQSRLLHQTLSMPVETPQKSLEDQAWRAAARMQADLESELLLLREKLLNIHLQFCSGATHENLVYDLAFTAEGIQTVLTTASDLGRSFAIVKEHLHQDDATVHDQEVVAIIEQISSLRNSVKRMVQQLRDLSDKLQVAVEDVPDGKRFDSPSAAFISRGPHGNPSV